MISIEELSDVDFGRLIALEARSWCGTPFVHQARGPKGAKGGVDCVGLGVCIGERLGQLVHDFTAYPKCPSSEQLVEYLSKNCYEVPLKEKQTGDFLLIHFVGFMRPTHVVIQDYDEYIIHANRNRGQVERRLLNPAWSKRIVSVWRYKRWQR